MKEIIFEVLEDPAGGYTASALGCGVHTQGETVEDLKAQNCSYVALWKLALTKVPLTIRFQ